MNLTILGAGVFGSALGQILTKNGHAVQYFDPYKFPDRTLDQALDFSSTPTSSPDPAQNPAPSSAQSPTNFSRNINVAQDKNPPAPAQPPSPTAAVILATPSSAAESLLAQIPADLPLICATKGFLSLAPFAKFSNFSVLSGPAFASDLIQHLQNTNRTDPATPASANITPTPASPNTTTDHPKSTPAKNNAAPAPRITLTATSPLIPQLFATPWLHFDRTADRLGVLLCGSLKNVYAIGAGLRQLSPDNNQEKNTPIPPLYHKNAKKSIENAKNPQKSLPLDQKPLNSASPNSPLSAYLSAALAELKLILKANHADPATADLACGIGDLTLTCSSLESRNYQYGLALARELSTSPKSTDFSPNSAIPSPISASTSPSPATPTKSLTLNTTLEGLSALKNVNSYITIPANCQLFNSIQNTINLGAPHVH